MYANGRGVARDDTIAATFFELSARAGHEQARRMLRAVGAESGPLPDCMRAPEDVAAIPRSASFAITVDDADPLAGLPAWKQKIAAVVLDMAPRYSVDPRFALAVIAIESNFDPTATSVRDARGLMQLIPDTAARFNVQDAWNVQQNIRGGLSYLRWLLAYYEGRVALAVAAYNAGEAAVDKYGGVPPYAETREYVRRIKRLFESENHPFDARVARPSPVVARASAAR
jgi:soluble lytic murein transglycosylase-like protein